MLIFVRIRMLRVAPVTDSPIHVDSEDYPGTTEAMNYMLIGPVRNSKHLTRIYDGLNRAALHGFLGAIPPAKMRTVIPYLKDYINAPLKYTPLPYLLAKESVTDSGSFRENLQSAAACIMAADRAANIRSPIEATRLCSQK